MPYTIRSLTTYAEMVAIRRLQREIWGLDTPDLGLHPPLLLTAVKNGGVALGAFDTDTGQMVGFLFGFLGREPGGPLKLCSQIMGIRPEWRRQGIAEHLKRLQRERVIEQGLPLITWAYDPLEGPNARLNLHKLRTIARTYWRNAYGTDFGALNTGLPSDRLVVEWWLNGPWLDTPPDEEAAHRAAPIFETQGTGLARYVVQANLGLEAAALSLEIPADIQRLKAHNLELAYDWRLKVRTALEKYFSQGYIATDLLTTTGRSGERRNRYLLQKSSPALLAAIGIPQRPVALH